jgi:hypothetical protein
MKKACIKIVLRNHGDYQKTGGQLLEKLMRLAIRHMPSSTIQK